MSEPITTTATSATAPTVDHIVINSGDSPATFDELDAVEQSAKTAKRDAARETKEVVKETVKAMDKAKGDKDDKDSSSPKAKGEETKEGKEKDSKKAGDKEAEGKLGADKTEKAPKPKLKAKLADKEIEFDDETLIPVKLNGKEEMVSVKQLMSDFSGKKQWNQEFTSLGKEKKEFYSKVEDINSKISAIMNEQDPELRFYHMAQFSGKNPIEVRQKFLNDNMNLLEKYYAMSDDERKADAVAFENKVMKHQLESQAKAEQKRQADIALSARYQKLEQTHQISRDQLLDRQEYLKNAKILGPNGQPQEITPEFAAETIVKERLWDSAANILDNSQAANLTAEKRQELLFDLVDTAYATGLSPADISDVAKELWEDKSNLSAVEAKVDEAEEFRTGKKAKETKPKEVKEAAMFFDEIL